MEDIFGRSAPRDPAVRYRRRQTDGAAPGRVLLVVCLLVCGAGQSGCGSSDKPIDDEAKAAGKTEKDFAADGFDYFRDMDAAARQGDPGGADARPQPLRLSPDEIKGRNTWILWTGGNEAFWDWQANHSYGFIDLLKLVDFRPQHPWARFAQAGLNVEPNTRVPLTADRYGLYIRQSVDETARQPSEETFGRSSGIVGLRLYRNPWFDAAAAKRWDVARYYNDPTYYLDPTLVRPYRVGMACGFCHIAPHPLNPPVNVEEPNWSNLSATIGNQYLRTRRVFGNLLEPDAYFYHVLDSQLPGTLDTSLIASDNINNASTKNAIWELGGRLDRAGLFDHRTSEYVQDYTSRYGTNPVERAGDAAARLPVLFYGPYAYANPRPAPRFLLDGSDSAGPWLGLARVYLNIGTYHTRWVTLHNPLFGYKSQKPFTLADAEQGSVYWRATGRLMDDLARYLLKASGPMRLRNAPGGQAHVKGAGVPWAPELAAGRRVFASHCIVCHSSKQPKLFDETPASDVLRLLRDQGYKDWAEREVERWEFWQENYLSTDRRLPISLVRTNANRSLASNGIEGSVWEEFSSKAYKGLPPSAPLQVWNPFTRNPEEMTLPRGGRGYYRPASLVSVWATAPLLHNNSVGLFNNDPSVEGRVRAFRDAIHKLLAPGQSEGEAAAARWRLGSSLNGATWRRLEHDHGVIWRLPQDASIRIPASQLAYFVSSLTGWPVALIERPWLAPLLSLAMATPCIIFARRRLLRRLGYFLTVIAFVVALPAYFVAGKLMDLSIGPLPAGLPVNVVANIDPQQLKAAGLLANARRGIRVLCLIMEISGMPPGTPATDRKIDDLGSLLHEVSRSRDYVMDRGHYFGAELQEQERQDLIDLLLTF
jgi:hypothetical protein